MSTVGGKGKEKSQARASSFLVVFMLLVPTVLAAGYAANVTGNVPAAEELEPVESAVNDMDSANPIADILEKTDSEEPASDEMDERHQEGNNETAEQPEETEEANQTNNPCEGVVCEDTTITCPDGYGAVCTSACDPETGQCISCTPDCSGHQTPENETAESNNETEPENETCIEDWTCSEWSECADGIQTRECTDNSSCGTEKNRPAEQDGCRQPDTEEPIILVVLQIPERVTRGGDYGFAATIENTGTGIADDINPRWIIPEGLLLLGEENDCGSLGPQEQCTSHAKVHVTGGAIGVKNIRLVADYV